MNALAIHLYLTIRHINLSFNYFGNFYRIIVIAKLSEYRDSRKGRIQHPFITRIIQKYGLYIQRQGLPRIPLEAIFTQEEIAKKQAEQEAEEG